MKVSKEHFEIAERLGEGIFMRKPFGILFSLEKDSLNGNWYIATLDEGWNEVDTFRILDMWAGDAVKLPDNGIERCAILLRNQAAQDKLGRCTPHSCCPSHAMQQLEDMAAETCDCDNNPVMQLFGSLIAAREVADEETVTGFISDSETNDMYKVTIQYIGNRSDE